MVLKKVLSLNVLYIHNKDYILKSGEQLCRKEPEMHKTCHKANFYWFKDINSRKISQHCITMDTRRFRMCICMH